MRNSWGSVKNTQPLGCACGSETQVVGIRHFTEPRRRGAVKKRLISQSREQALAWDRGFNTESKPIGTEAVLAHLRCTPLHSRESRRGGVPADVRVHRLMWCSRISL